MRILVALLLLVSPASADVSDGVWFSPEVPVDLFFDGLEFKKYVSETDSFIQCKITEWPVSSPEASATCEDGLKHTLIIDKDSVTFDGTDMLNRPFGLE